MNVVWTDEAKAHLNSIFQYIKRDSPLYTTRMID